MEKHSIAIEYESFDELTELSEQEQDLLAAAHEGLSRSYAPYSNFRVSAALRLQDGSVVVGTNQENAAYPSGLCAERVAFFTAHSNHPEQPVLAVAVVVKSANFDLDAPVSPCGACRQVMLEYEMNQENDIVVLCQGDHGTIYKLKSIKSLLPLHFYENRLRK